MRDRSSCTRLHIKYTCILPWDPKEQCWLNLFQGLAKRTLKNVYIHCREGKQLSSYAPLTVHHKSDETKGVVAWQINILKANSINWVIELQQGQCTYVHVYVYTVAAKTFTSVACNTCKRALQEYETDMKRLMISVMDRIDIVIKNGR